MDEVGPPVEVPRRFGLAIGRSRTASISLAFGRERLALSSSTAFAICPSGSAGSRRTSFGADCPSASRSERATSPSRRVVISALPTAGVGTLPEWLIAPGWDIRTYCPSPASLRAQQSRFDNFRYVFNNERPHEGLNNQVPASIYIPSAIRLPRKLPEFRYPKGLQLRRVNNSGDISWHKNRIFISEVFRFEELGFELTTPGLYKVFFRDMEIGEFNTEELRFRAARRVV